MAIARLQKRDIAICHFSSMGEVRVDVFPKGQGSIEQVLDTAEHFFCGYTYYPGWMQQAMKMVEGSMFDRADVIIVSDGDVDLEKKDVEAWTKLRTERDMRCQSILIGPREYVREGSWQRKELEKISNGVVSLVDLTDEGEALETMFSL